MGYNCGFYAEALSFAVYILFLPFKIAVLQFYITIFAIFSQKSCLKVLRLRKKAVPLHRIRTIKAII